jgi:hypothetical protein
MQTSQNQQLSKKQQVLERLFLNYPKQNAYLCVRFLDEACYAVHDYVWVYNTNVGHSPKRFTTAHRSILHCRKTAHNKFFKEQVAQPYQNPTDNAFASA